MPTIYHMVHYRRFIVNSDSPVSGSFEALCRSALNATDPTSKSLWERAQDRSFDLADSANRQIFLNKVADLSSAIFGELCLVQQGDLQALLELRTSTVQLSNVTTAEIFNLGERHAPNGSQFVRGMAYWLAVGDHVLFVKTHAMLPDHIQAYFDWLLKAQTATIGTSISFKLQAEFDRAQIVGDVGEIRSLRVSGKSSPQLAVTILEANSDRRVVETARAVGQKFVQFAQAIPIIEALFGKSKADSLAASLRDGEYFAVDASVKVRGPRSVESRAKMREIASALADATDGKVQIEGKDGKISDGDAILRTRMPFDLPHAGSNLLEFDNVSDQLQEVYNRFVRDRKIEA